MTDDKIISFADRKAIPTAKLTPDNDVMALLQALLKEASEGDIQFFACAYVGHGVARTTWSPEHSTPTILTAAIGATNMLNYRILESVHDNSDTHSYEAPDTDPA